jgi:hypothetical protein
MVKRPNTRKSAFLRPSTNERVRENERRRDLMAFDELLKTQEVRKVELIQHEEARDKRPSTF